MSLNCKPARDGLPLLEAVESLGVRCLEEAGLSKQSVRFSAFLKEKMLCPTFDIDPSKPWNGRNLSTPSTGLGHLFLPFPELKLSGPAAELLCAELAKWVHLKN